MRSNIYTAKLLLHHVRSTVTTQWLQHDSVVTFDNCRQHGDWTTQLFNCVVSVLLAVNNGDDTITVQSLCRIGDWWNRSFAVCMIYLCSLQSIQCCLKWQSLFRNTSDWCGSKRFDTVCIGRLHDRSVVQIVFQRKYKCMEYNTNHLLQLIFIEVNAFYYIHLLVFWKTIWTNDLLCNRPTRDSKRIFMWRVGYPIEIISIFSAAITCHHYAPDYAQDSKASPNSAVVYQRGNHSNNKLNSHLVGPLMSYWRPL